MLGDDASTAILIDDDKPESFADAIAELCTNGARARSLATAARARLVNVFPLDRIREFVRRGEVGSLAETYYSFMGAQRPPYEMLLHDSGPEVARRLRADRVEVVFLTGT